MVQADLQKLGGLMDRCDLHMHTTFSDGTATPAELVARAKKNSVRCIALTDHDTLAGLEDCFLEGAKQGVEIIAGTELSIDYREKTTHLLGYFSGPKVPTLEQRLSGIRGGRDNRNEKICQKLQALGLAVTLAEVEAIATESVGRPHIAQILMQKGYVASVREAFDKYLEKGRPGYVGRDRLTPGEAIGAIREAGGVPVLAHPYLVGPMEEIDTVLDDLVPFGLLGVECVYSEHSREQVSCFQAAAEKRGLLVTGGSDFHGTVKPHLDIGVGRGELFVPYELAIGLRKRLGLV
jgi:3',5'-nucleoside bisphosphate phosphatase